MGRTVGAILAIAAIVVINLIPGVGQAITAAIVSAGLSAATAAAITATLTAVITSAALSIVSAALFSATKAKPPETASTAIKTSTPPRVSAYGQGRLYGAYILYTNTDYSAFSSDTFSPYGIDVFAVHDGPIDSIVQRYLGDDKVFLNAGHYVSELPNNQYGEPTVRWFETLGGAPGTANFAQIAVLLPGIWTSEHRGDGVVCLGIIWRPVKSEDFNERFPQGAAPASIAAKWQRCFDWRDETQSVASSATWKWTDNAVLHLAHYRLVREKARKQLGEIYPSEAALLDAWALFFEPTIDYWTEAANVAGANSLLKSGFTEPRYRSCLAHKHTDPHKDVLEALTSCFDGWTAPRADGALVVYAGQFYEPTVSIGADEIVSYSWQHGVVDEEAVNELKITYVSEAHDYNVVEAEPWTDQDDILARGAIRTQGIDFQVPSHAQARRLAKRFMARVMANNRGVITTNVAGRIVRGERYINLKIKEAGATFFDGVAEITQLSRNVATGGVTFSWVEVSANIDAWNPETEEGDPAPVGDVVALVAPAAPVIDSAVLLYDSSSSAGTGARVAISLSGPSGTDLVWFARWRVVGDPVWNEQRYSDVDSSVSVELVTDFVPVGETVEVAVAYRHGGGKISPWSTPATEVDTDTEATAPDAAASITLGEWSNRMQVTTAPIARASSYRWRFYLADGVTLRRTKTTSIPEVFYASAEAHQDGISRSYKVDVAGVNGAGPGTAFMSGVFNNPAPAAVTGVAFADGVSSSEATFTLLPGSEELIGYKIAWSTVSGFDPMTQGAATTSTGQPAYTSQLPAGSYYGKVAGFDLWTAQPDQLNFSAQDAFTITTGTGGASSGGGGGGGWQGGGGFVGNPIA